MFVGVFMCVLNIGVQIYNIIIHCITFKGRVIANQNVAVNTFPGLVHTALETTAKGTGLAESAGKEDPVELDSSPTL